jgi:succinate dehydrogenase / fumarate reductase cytochrome b subunit
LFNLAANFMATNPMIKIMEPVLALGFIIHIICLHGLPWII